MLLVPLSFIITACSEDDDQAADLSWLVGDTWIGSHSYYNPVSGTKTNWEYFKFNKDGTGDYSLETQTNYAEARFRYSVKGSTIYCQGVSAGTDGGVNESWRAELTASVDKTILYHNGFELHKHE